MAAVAAANKSAADDASRDHRAEGRPKKEEAVAEAPAEASAGASADAESPRPPTPTAVAPQAK